VVAITLDKTAPKNTLYCASVFGKAFSLLLAGAKLEDIGDPTVSIRVKNHLRPMLEMIGLRVK
jgi:hypothetical protein